MAKKQKKILDIPSNNLTKIRTQAKQCCYRDGGECVILDCNCVVAQDETIIECKWFIEAVLPANVELCNTVMKHNGVRVTKYNKTCKQCGCKYKTESKTSTYCNKCSKQRELERKREYKRRQGK